MKMIYLGLKGSVIAVDSATGQLVWETDLKGVDFVNVIIDGNNLFATTRGEIYCLDPQGGGIRWHNPLKGYGLGLVTIAADGVAPNTAVIAAEKRRRDQQQASAATGATAAS
jgi:outer membrane protein assembly factor BamB